MNTRKHGRWNVKATFEDAIARTLRSTSTRTFADSARDGATKRGVWARTMLALGVGIESDASPDRNWRYSLVDALLVVATAFLIAWLLYISYRGLHYFFNVG